MYTKIIVAICVGGALAVFVCALVWGLCEARNLYVQSVTGEQREHLEKIADIILEHELSLWKARYTADYALRGELSDAERKQILKTAREIETVGVIIAQASADYGDDISIAISPARDERLHEEILRARYLPPAYFQTARALETIAYEPSLQSFQYELLSGSVDRVLEKTQEFLK